MDLTEAVVKQLAQEIGEEELEHATRFQRVQGNLVMQHDETRCKLCTIRQKFGLMTVVLTASENHLVTREAKRGER